MRFDLKVMAGITALGCSACTQPNPAFLDSEGRTTESSESSASDTTVDTTESATDTTDATDTQASSDVTTSDATTDTATTDTTDTANDATDTSVDTTDTTDTGGEACMLPANTHLSFKIYSEAGLEPCGEMVDAWFYIEGPSPNNQLLASPCEAGCDICTDGNMVELEAYPADMSDFAYEVQGSCVHMRATEYVSGGANYCQYNKAMLWALQDSQEQLPIFVGSSGDGAIPDYADAFLSNTGLSWALVEDEVCDCPAASDPCCKPDDPPTIYGFMVDQTLLRPGDVWDVELGPENVWEFHPYQADYLDSCGANLEVSWMFHLTAPGG